MHHIGYISIDHKSFNYTIRFLSFSLSLCGASKHTIPFRMVKNKRFLLLFLFLSFAIQEDSDEDKSEEAKPKDEL